MLNKIRPITIALVAALAVTLSYTSCKKSETTTQTAIDQKDLSLKLVKNFNDSFTGNLNSSQTNSADKQRVNSPNGCNTPRTLQINDSVTVQAAGTTYKAKGFIRLTTLCTTDQWTALGYKLVDSIYSVGTTATSETRATIKENYTALTPTVGDYGTVKCNGTQSSHIVVINKSATPVQTVDQTNKFTLHDLVVTTQKVTNATILSGDASFNVNGTIDHPKNSYRYSGTITFLGNGLARVAFSDVTYLVNLNTGAVTKQ